MEEYTFIQSCRKLNYHDDIILRTPTLSTGERMLSMCFKNSKDNSRILEFDHPECEKDILEIMKDFRWNAERFGYPKSEKLKRSFWFTMLWF